MKYLFRPSHGKCQEKTEAAGTFNYNFLDFSTKRLEDLFILYSEINPPLATGSYFVILEVKNPYHATVLLKGLSHDMDLAFDDMHGHNRGRGQFLNFLGAPNDL
jgi:hypothetical protein